MGLRKKKNYENGVTLGLYNQVWTWETFSSFGNIGRDKEELNWKKKLIVKVKKPSLPPSFEFLQQCTMFINFCRCKRFSQNNNTNN